MSSSFSSLRAVSHFLATSVLSGGAVVSQLRAFVASGHLSAVCHVAGRRCVFQQGSAFRCFVSRSVVFVVVPSRSVPSPVSLRAAAVQRLGGC